jgi:uncharacterized protein (DUF3084 family)
MFITEMVGLNIISQCEQLLQDISNLRTQLDTTTNEKERKRINHEIEAKEVQYNDLQCGAIDPPKNDNGEIGPRD